MTAPLPAVLEYPHAAPPEPGRVTEVATGVLWLRMPLPFALDHINLWALADRIDGVDGWTLVDTGYGNAQTREIWEAQLSGSLAGRPVLQLIATHYHPDHLGNGAWLSSRFGCAITMTQAEYLTARAVSEALPGHSPKAASELFVAHGLPREHADAIEARGNRYRQGVPELPATYRRLMARDYLSIGGRTWRIILGYGHSPEHAALFCPDLELLISGDMLLPKISTNISVWPVDPDADPLSLFLESLTRFEALPSQTLVLPSHGLPFRGIALRVDQLRAHHEARLDEIINTASAPMTANDAVAVLFRRPLDAHQRHFAMGEAIAHLNMLWHDGRLRRSRSAVGPWQFVRC